MPPTDEIEALKADMIEWRRHLHTIPETAFEEKATSSYVATLLESFGLQVERGLAGTGIVATLKGNRTGPAIGLRADMDALDIEERTNREYRSRRQGKMHACGHDGHMSMLLGAARHLAAAPDFSGTVHFIFQPAEENEGGGRRMIEDGLFRRFPMSAVYGLHNWPGQRFGTFALKPGPLMAAYDIFELTLHGRGGHGAMPHETIDPVVIAGEIIGALQTIASRTVHPVDSAVVSVTQVHGGDSWNVIPTEIVLRGTARSFKPEVQDRIEMRIGEIARGICAAHGATSVLRYERRYPATINHAEETEVAGRAAAQVVGADNLIHDPMPSMASEDFAFMLNACPGNYIWLGTGDGPNLHSPLYDFNDDALVYGARYWAALVKTALP
jgi:hippurate hydrolase